MAKKAPRRTSQETEELARKVAAAIRGGMMKSEALRKFDLVGSVYRRFEQNLGLPSKPGGIERGSVDARSFPPRPKTGKVPRVPRPVNENDVGSLAHRISVLDRKLAGVTEMQKERKTLASRLMKLLAGDTPPAQ